jgi:cycloartenol synthase
LQNKDGGWGLHIEGPSTMFGSVLCYVTLRLLGEGPNDGEGEMEKARDWILQHGGATYITSWGKMWLSVKILAFIFFHDFINRHGFVVYLFLI